MPYIPNPLRYPGAKSTLAPYVSRLLVANNLDGATMVEPFAGSSSVGLMLLQDQVIDHLVIVEKDVLLYSFWQSVFTQTQRLIDRIENTPISLDTWHEIKAYRTANPDEMTQEDILNLGFAGLFLNRTNFSGILNANPLGGLQQKSPYPIDCRFHKEREINSIWRLSQYAAQVDVMHLDALQYLENGVFHEYENHVFIYIDPPYYEKGKMLYRHSFNDIEHLHLARIIRNGLGCDWLLSYDDHQFIRSLYQQPENQMMAYHFDYSAASRNRNHAQELLISNLPLPPVDVFAAVGI